MRRPCKPERRGGKKGGRRKEEWREGAKRERKKALTGFSVLRASFLIACSTPRLPHANKMRKKSTHMLTHHADLRLCEPFKEDSSEKNLTTKLTDSTRCNERPVHECLSHNKLEPVRK